MFAWGYIDITGQYLHVCAHLQCQNKKPDLITVLFTWIYPDHDDVRLEQLTETECNSHKHHSFINLD